MADSLEIAKMPDGALVPVLRLSPKGRSIGSIVLLHEIFGVTDDIVELGRVFCAAGYDIFVPSLFERADPGFVGTYSDTDAARGLKLIRELHPLQQSVDDALHCAQMAETGQPVFMVGYCYGGSVAWACANQSRALAGISAFYGAQIIGNLSALEPQCPALLHFGTEDQSIPIRRVKEWCERSSAQATVKYYEAGHGFCSAGRPTYDAEASRLALNDALEHFEQIRTRGQSGVLRAR